MGRRIAIHGIVQGVGFRPWVYRLAQDAGVAGRVRNDLAGVTIEAFGSPDALDRFARGLDSPPRAADVRTVESLEIPDEPVDRFEIAISSAVGPRQVSIPPDLATCPLCLAEIFDPANRRYRYAFTNCTNCGPRFTIAREAPYDRRVTTMAAFTMCPACQAEYENPADRRFHAEPNACPACGPHLLLCGVDGVALDEVDPVQAAGAALVAGRIVAVKGIGGFHLACDATNASAVARLRQRKHRDEKPFAVMVPHLRDAERHAVLTDAHRERLVACERPIVLVPRRPATPVSDLVAPRNPLLGLLLPYTPLHHLLLHDVDRPVVMTSANLSDEPLVYRNDEAIERLAGLADLLLVHDRAIQTPCDDSVVRVIADRPVVLRRSRGYVPRAIPLARPVDVPVLACGAQLKNTFCVASGATAVLGPHVGDLDSLATFDSFVEGIARLCRFLDVTPAVIAHDLHPDYLSTRYAQSRPELQRFGVQHHHAHIASAMAEHGLAGPVIGVAYDGTGYGPDGTAWGGEVLIASDDRFERLATFRAIPLPGGDAAIRHPWRVALALLTDACGDQIPLDAFPLFAGVPAREMAGVQRLLASGLNTPMAHGAGRYFDGVAALVLARGSARYEGQLALELNLVADPSERRRYGFGIDRRGSPWTLDFRPMVADIVADVRQSRPVEEISARFHNTLVVATAAVVRFVVEARGPLPIVLTGGCFQNARLAEDLAADLAPVAPLHLHRQVPPGDGGIALGQAVIAAALARRTDSAGS